MAKRKPVKVKCKVVLPGAYVTLKRPEKYIDDDGDEKTRLKHTTYNTGKVFECTLKEATNWLQTKPHPLVEILDEEPEEIPDVDDAEGEETTEGKDGIERKG